ncbi:hypothetical protein D3C76_1643190 [compost metagenome]
MGILNNQIDRQLSDGRKRSPRMAHHGVPDRQQIRRPARLYERHQVHQAAVAQVLVEPGAPGHQQRITGECGFAQQIQIV